MAESFNRMVSELGASRLEVEGYSRNLEGMVEARTGELRDSQASLLALKNHLATVIANVGTGVLSLDEEGRIETFNERASEILGLAPEGARGRTLEEALGALTTARLVEAVALVRDGGEDWHEAQIVCELPQGRRTLAVVASALRGEGHRPIGTVVVIEDLTQVLATQRLEAWKEAVERVIHEVKNPLTPVGLAAETLKTAWARDKDRFADLFPSAIDMILGAVRDLKELIGEFSRFSRLPPMRPERVDPNALVLDALSPYTQAPLDRLQVRVDLAPDVPEVEVDADQVKRVLLNVINNALEAMAEKGGELRLRTAREDGGVAIRVDDAGPGVEDVERIFEPHYTTKVKGTGLGLAIARQIVEEHGGTIRAESAPGKGTSVRIYLPAAPRPEASSLSAGLATGPCETSHGSALQPRGIPPARGALRHVDRRVRRVPHGRGDGRGRVLGHAAGDALALGLPHHRLGHPRGDGAQPRDPREEAAGPQVLLGQLRGQGVGGRGEHAVRHLARLRHQDAQAHAGEDEGVVALADADLPAVHVDRLERAAGGHERPPARPGHDVGRPGLGLSWSGSRAGRPRGARPGRPWCARPPRRRGRARRRRR